MSDINKVPYLLRGNLFKIVSVSKNNKHVLAKCSECLNIYKGNMTSKGNFYIHIKRKHPHLLPQIEKIRLASNGRESYKKTPRLKTISRQSVKRNSITITSNNEENMNTPEDNMDSADCEPTDVQTEQQTNENEILQYPLDLTQHHLEITSQQESEQINNQNNHNISTNENRNSEDGGNDEQIPPDSGTNIRNDCFENMTRTFSKLEDHFSKIKNSLERMESILISNNFLKHYKLMKSLSNIHGNNDSNNDDN